jgi:hypothetical protein
VLAVHYERETFCHFGELHSNLGQILQSEQRTGTQPASDMGAEALSFTFNIKLLNSRSLPPLYYTHITYMEHASIRQT